MGCAGWRTSVPALDRLLFAGDALLPLPAALSPGPAAARIRSCSPVTATAGPVFALGRLCHRKVRSPRCSAPRNTSRWMSPGPAGGSQREPTALVRKIPLAAPLRCRGQSRVAQALGLVVADEQVLRERIADGGAPMIAAFPLLAAATVLLVLGLPSVVFVLCIAALFALPEATARLDQALLERGRAMVPFHRTGG